MESNAILKYYEQRFGPFVRLAPLDKSIWLRYLMQGGEQFAPFSYDVRVGDGVAMPVGTSAQGLKIAYDLTTKRIDAVCIFDGRVRIIEVKQRAGLGAIGQLIGYKQLYDRTANVNLPSDMWLITDELQPDVRPVLIANNINFVEVGY